MSIAIAVTHVAAALLVVSGVMKLRRPRGTVLALRALGFGDRVAAVAAVGAGEVVIGAAALVLGGSVAVALVGAAYALFAVAVLRLRRRDAAAPCGCFGSAIPPTGMHVAVNGVITGAAAIAATGNAPSLFSALTDQPLAGLPYLLLLATATYCVYALLSVVPMVSAAPAAGASVVEFSLR